MIPSDIAGLVLWLKADQISGADGDPVATWQDQSGNGDDAVQSSAPARPTLQTNEINGKPVVRFDGTDDFMATSGIFPSASNYSMFIVASAVAASLGAGGRAFITIRPNTGDVSGFLHFLYRNDLTNNARIFYSSDGGASNQVIQNPIASFSFDAFQLHSVVAGATGVWYINGTQQDSDTIVQANFSSAVVHLGAYFEIVPSGGFLQGDIAEVIIYNSALSAADRNSLGGYIQTKYGLTIAGATFPAVGGGSGVISPTIRKAKGSTHELDNDYLHAVLFDNVTTNLTSDFVVVEGFAPTVLIAGAFTGNVTIEVAHPPALKFAPQGAAKTAPAVLTPDVLGGAYAIRAVTTGMSAGGVRVSVYGPRRR